MLTYLPSQEDGNFHVLAVLVRNTTRKVAINVGGQISVFDSNHKLVKSVNPTEINILPKAEGLLLDDTLDLPQPLTQATVITKLIVERFAKSSKKSPVSFSNLQILPEADGLSGCSITGTVSNRFSAPKDDLQIEVAGFSTGKMVTAGFTYVDHVFPRTDATFEVDLVDTALCPATVDGLKALPNLGEDKIFDP